MLVSDLQADVASILSGLDLKNVENEFGAYERAARTFTQKAKPPEAEGRQNIILYSNVFDYALDSKIFGTTVRDLKPQGITRTPYDTVRKQYADAFDRSKNMVFNGSQIAFEYLNGTPILRVSTINTIQRIILDTMASITGWVASGFMSTPVQDTAVYYQIPASLRFNLTGAGVGSLTKTLSSSIDLTRYEGLGVIFLPVYISDPTKITNLIAKIGSDSGNYYTETQTAGFIGALQANQWQLVAFDLSTATTVGTPDITKIAYLQMSITATGALTNVRFGGLWISLPYPATLLFQTSAFFIPLNQTIPIKTITASTDTVILNDAARSIYTYECAKEILLQSGGSLNDPVMTDLNQNLYGVRARSGAIVQMGLYDHYRGDNPDEGIRTVGSYYP